MEVAWKNPHFPNKSEGHFACACDVCGTMKFPFNHYGCYELGVGWTIAGYEYPYWVCSIECEEIARSGKMKKKHIELNKSFGDMYDLKMPLWVKKVLQ